MPRLRLVLVFMSALAAWPACAAEPAATTGAREPVVGLPCEGCEAVFEGLPAALPSEGRIAPPGEPGRPLRIVGTVFTAAGQPAPGVVVYAYQTNDQGLYPPDAQHRGTAAHHHGRLRGWVRTDDQGRYTFNTVRPGGYPRSDLPAHVHMHVIEPGRCTYYIDDILFADDPRLTAAKKAELVLGRGGSGLAAPIRGGDGVQVVRRDIHLGRNIPGYPGDVRR